MGALQLMIYSMFYEEDRMLLKGLATWKWQRWLFDVNSMKTVEDSHNSDQNSSSTDHTVC